MAALIVGLAGCTTTTLAPVPLSTGAPTPGGRTDPAPTAGSTATIPSTLPSGTPTLSGSSTPSGAPTASAPAAPPGEPAPITPDAATTPEAAPTRLPPATAFSPAPDAAAVDGSCPYLGRDQVQADTGQRIGSTQIRPAEPHPVCEFLRSDGEFLASVRVLQLDSAAVAVAAVDFSVPRDTSNPESRPAGWSGGSLAGDDGSVYAVSRDTYAVIAETNQRQTVYARLLATHAIENLGL